MRRRLRNGLAVLLAVPVLLAGGALAWLAGLDADRYRDDIGAWLSEATGRPVTIAGGIEFRVLPQPALRVRQLQVGNAPWASGEPMLAVSELELRVAPLALLQGRLSVPRLAVRGARLRLERGADGSVNWRPAGVAPDTGARPAGVPTLVFDQLQVTDLGISYLDAAHGQAVAMRLHEIDISSPQAHGELTAQGRGELSGATLEIALGLSSLGALLAGREADLQARLRLAEATLRVAGVLPAGGAAPALRVDLQAPSLGGLVDVAALLAPAADALHELAPALMPLAPVALSAELEVTGPAVLRLDALRLQAGGDSVTGALRVQTVPRLRIEGELKVPRLRLAEPAGAGTGERRLFSTAPLPWGAIDDIDLQLDVQGGEWLLGELALRELDLPLRLAAGEVLATPAFMLAGGKVRGELRLAAGERRVRLTLDADGIDVGRLQRELGLGEDVSGVPASLHADLRGAGDSLAGLAGSLDGEVLLKAGAGRVDSDVFAIAGADLLLAFLRAVGVSEGGEMVLECGVARLRISDGIASAGDGVGLRFNRANVIGGGSIDLGRETLDLRLALQPREGIGLSAGTALANMVAVRGTLAEPRVTLSAEGVASTGAKVGAAVITGGLSLLVGALVDRVTADDDPCRTALGAAAAAAAPAATQPARGRKKDD